MRLRNGKADSVCEALAKRAGRDLDAVSVASLGVTWSQRIDLAELLEIIQGQFVAEEVE